MQIPVHDFHFFIALYVRGGHFAVAMGVNGDHLGLIGEYLRGKILQVENNLSHIFLDARHRGELMLHTLDANIGNCHAGQRVKQHSAQRIAQSLAKSALQRLYNELAVAFVFANLQPFDSGFFDFDHSAIPPHSRGDPLMLPNDTGLH